MKLVQKALLIAMGIFAVSAYAGITIVQPTTGTNSETVVGGELFVDSGNTGANYSSNEDGSTTFCAAADAPVTLTIDAFAVEENFQNGCWDTVTFFNGNSTGAPVIFAGCGDPDDLCDSNDAVCIEAGDSFTSTSGDGCITVGFDSDGSVTFNGWEMTVGVQGGGEPTLSLGTNDVDFGTVAVDGLGDSAVLLSNTGTATLDVTAISDPGAPFSLPLIAPFRDRGLTVSCSAPPFSIDPGQSCAVNVFFEPTAPGVYLSSFDITSNAASSPDTVTVRGSVPFPEAQVVPTMSMLGLIALMLVLGGFGLMLMHRRLNA